MCIGLDWRIQAPQTPSIHTNTKLIYANNSLLVLTVITVIIHGYHKCKHKRNIKKFSKKIELSRHAAHKRHTGHWDEWWEESFNDKACSVKAKFAGCWDPPGLCSGEMWEAGRNWILHTLNIFTKNRLSYYKYNSTTETPASWWVLQWICISLLLARITFGNSVCLWNSVGEIKHEELDFSS